MDNLNGSISECVIAHTVLNDKVLLAKNRDRAYEPTISIVRDLIDGVELVYILDIDTDWSEGMNSNGIGLVNSALMVTNDENEKKIIKKKGKPGPDGGKIRLALSKKTLAKALQSITNYKGVGKFALMGHTFICSPEESISIEVTSTHIPVIKRLNRKLNHARTNHGYDYPDSGYTDGKPRDSSESRWGIAQKVLDSAKVPADILNGLSGIYPVNRRDNPYRDSDKVKGPTEKDVLSTSTQILMNLNDLVFNVRADKLKSTYNGIDDRTPSDYKPKIKINVEYVKNTKKSISNLKEMKKTEFISEVFKDEVQMLAEGKTLRVFDWDDTLGKSTSYIYVNHADGKQTKLDPAEYAVYKEKSGDEYDFKDFNRMMNNPSVIKKNFALLKRMLKNPQKKVTILTARKLAFPVRKYLKDTFGMDVYVVALGSNNPKDKADWIEKHIKTGYTDIAFMDDSSKNIAAVDRLKSKYPNVRIKTQLVREHIEEEIQQYVNKIVH